LPEEKPKEQSKNIDGLTAAEAAELAEAAAKSAAVRLETAKSAAEAEAEKQYKAAAAEAIEPESGESFSHRHEQDMIFRREMGEPEFWIGKTDLAPSRRILTPAEEKEISRQVLIPKNQIPQYKPEHVLSPEFGGTTNYEKGVETVREEIEEKLHQLKTDPDANHHEIQLAEEDLKTLDYLYENYYHGMNVFRTAKGGRATLRE